MNKHMIGMLVGCGLMVVGLIWLASGGGVGNGLVWLLILACPLMHLFMGHDHGHGQEHEAQEEPSNDAPDGSPEPLRNGGGTDQ